MSKTLWGGAVGDSAAVLLPAFFALSGFLVMGSAVRVGSLSTFISYRALRILPALSTEVVLAAILIGPVTTSLPLSAYFSDPLFFRYFANIAGYITFLLPGVFLDNPLRTVNGSLWTIPPEISCYIFLALMLLSGGYRSKTTYIVLLVAMMAVNIRADATASAEVALATNSVLQYHLLLYFVIGNMAYLHRHAIPSHFLLFCAAPCSASFLSAFPSGPISPRFPSSIAPSFSERGAFRKFRFFPGATTLTASIFTPSRFNSL
jgi:peptidoglycan/LPS O-acetylase OafA/YrhL